MPPTMLNGVKVTIIGTSKSTVLASEFKLLPETFTIGDGRHYVIIPGACSIGIELSNSTDVAKYVTVSVAIAW